MYENFEREREFNVVVSWVCVLFVFCVVNVDGVLWWGYCWKSVFFVFFCVILWYGYIILNMWVSFCGVVGLVLFMRSCGNICVDFVYFIVLYIWFVVFWWLWLVEGKIILNLWMILGGVWLVFDVFGSCSGWWWGVCSWVISFGCWLWLVIGLWCL